MQFLGSEYKDLPADTTSAFIIFEDRLTKRLVRGFDGASLKEISLDKRIRYVTDIDQFIATFEIATVSYFDKDKVSNFELASKHFEEFYSVIQETVSSEKMMLIKQDVGQVFTSIELEPDSKIEIRGLVEKVKIHLDKMNLNSVKKDSLYKKLNVFLDEVDRSRTGLAAFAAAQVQVAYEAGLDEKKFETIISYFERIMKAMGRGAREQPQLPKPEEVKRIEGPQAEVSDGDE